MTAKINNQMLKEKKKMQDKNTILGYLFIWVSNPHCGVSCHDLPHFSLKAAHVCFTVHVALLRSLLSPPIILEKKGKKEEKKKKRKTTNSKMWEDRQSDSLPRTSDLLFL